MTKLPATFSYIIQCVAVNIVWSNSSDVPLRQIYLFSWFLAKEIEEDEEGDYIVPVCIVVCLAYIYISVIKPYSISILNTEYIFYQHLPLLV